VGRVGNPVGGRSPLSLPVDGGGVVGSVLDVDGVVGIDEVEVEPSPLLVVWPVPMPVPDPNCPADEVPTPAPTEELGIVGEADAVEGVRMMSPLGAPIDDGLPV